MLKEPVNDDQPLAVVRDEPPDGQHFAMGRRLVADNGERLIIIDGFLQHLSEIVAR